MRARLTLFMLLAIAAAVPLAASAQKSAAVGNAAELRALLDAALYPTQMMSHCYRDVDQNRDFQTAGIDWFVRNGEMLEALKMLAVEAGISSSERIEAEQRSSAAIVIEVAAQPDAPAYCRTVAKSIDYGKYDLVSIPDDLKPLLKQFF